MTAHDESTTPTPPTVSPDGRFWWDGAHWVPFQQSGPAPVAPFPSVRSRSPLGAVVLSLILPGAGHWYAGKIAFGCVLLAISVIASVFLTSAIPGTGDPVSALLGLAFVLVLYVYIAVDAHRSLKDWNAERGVTS